MLLLYHLPWHSHINKKTQFESPALPGKGKPSPRFEPKDRASNSLTRNKNTDSPATPHRGVIAPDVTLETKANGSMGPGDPGKGPIG